MTTIPSPSVFIRRLPNTVDAIGPLKEEISAWAEDHAIPMKVIVSIHLMLDDLLTNVVMHGYGEHAEGDIEVSLEVADNTLKVILRDWARAFDPFTIPAADTSLSIEERGIGGLGVHFVRKMADSFHYVRNGEANEIHLQKLLS